MNIMTKHMPMFLPTLLLLLWALFFNGRGAFAAITAENYNSMPPFVRTAADPNVMLDLSVESPMQGAAYNDQLNAATGCGGRDAGDGNVGRCYFPNQPYKGIFDPDKEYDYITTTLRFEPRGPTNADHSIKTSTRYSGNFLNWATMTAIDEFRYALTGGRRTVDTATETVIQRANMLLSSNNDWYRIKRIKTGDNVAPNTVGPFGANSKIYIYNHGYQIDIGTTRSGDSVTNLLKTNLNVQALVCVQSANFLLEPNCVSHNNGTIFKPEGLIQGHAERMRFAAMSYSLDGSRTRGGGVLRANMKYVGPTLPDGSDNPDKEYTTNGISSGINPDILKGYGSTNSGVINYVNKFGETASGYKNLDPAGELYYECLRYFMNIGPTPEYRDAYVDGNGVTQPALTNAQLENFPAIPAGKWEDPITSSCQSNYIVGINDANPWLDKKLPGTFFTTASWMGQDNTDDNGQPSNPATNPSDPVNVKTLTNTVGDLEGLTNSQQLIGCTAINCNNDCSTPKSLTNLGEVMGTCPDPIKQNSYYIAGLAYYAHTHDIRQDNVANPNTIGKQTITTFMIDTQEYKDHPLLGPMNMLWLAGKYGGFVESNHPDPDNINPTNNPNDANHYLRPDLDSEYNTTGDSIVFNGVNKLVPDNYVLATDPDKLVNGLNRVFDAIGSQGSSATAASVISGSQSGEGAVYQSIFFTQLTDTRTPPNSITWAGSVHALFVDELGRMREDTPPKNGILDASDQVVVFVHNQISNVVTVSKTDVSDPNNPTTVTGLPVTSINYLWSSENWLNSIVDTEIVQQRTYNDDTIHPQRRYIFTFVDADKNMIAGPGETLDFVAASGHPTLADLDGVTNPGTIYPYIPVSFDATSLPSYVDATNRNQFLQQQTQRVIEYTRGKDQGAFTLSAGVNPIIPAFRSRQINLDNTGMKTWRLGDIVNSSPTAVSKPAEALHLLYRDSSYATFAAQYQQRRTVVYTGANDGMLHAFNGGFFEDRFDVFPATLDGRRDVRFLRQPLRIDQSVITTDVAGHYIARHDLGAELWAYVPYNLLPHLYWPTESDYGLKKHVSFVDLKPRVFDARIFTPDTDHPGGWGTVLVGGMRFGGGKIDVDMNRTDGNANHVDRTMTSAYFILDITNPEVAPTVLGEINFPGQGYTTCYPTVITMGELGGSVLPFTAATQNNWYLVFGSGPAEGDGTPGITNSLKEATSSQSPRLYVVDLVELAKNKHLVTLAPNTPIPSPACPNCYQRFDSDGNAFISDPISVDYQLDYKSDAVYFGTVSGNNNIATGGWGGKLRRIVIDNKMDTAQWVGDSVLLGDESGLGFHQPITAAPTASTDSLNRRWVFFGTGRFFTSGANGDALNPDQQAYYGIKEPIKDDGSGDPSWATVTRQSSIGPPTQPGLLDVSNAHVFQDRSVTGVPGVTTWQNGVDGLVDEINSHSGWMLNFSRARERNIGQAALLGSTLTFTTYVPPAGVCDFDGESVLYGVFYTTGTEYFRPMLRRWDVVTSQWVGTREIELGLGLAATPNIHVGGKDGSTIFVQNSTGEIITIDELNATPAKTGMRSWRLDEQ